MAEAPAWLTSVFGVVAGVCSIAQLHPANREDAAGAKRCGVSLRMCAVTIAGFVCWAAYGLLSRSWPVAVANAVCLVLVSTILGLRLRFGDKPA